MRIENIHARLEDVYNLSGSWDVIYEFFRQQGAGKFLPLCKKLIAVVGKEAESELFPGKYRKMKKNTAEDTENILLRIILSIKLRTGSLNSGNPSSQWKPQLCQVIIQRGYGQ